ncbi:MAG: hypothetical protein ABW066_06780, partial [Sedimenticola sp.]
VIEQRIKGPQLAVAVIEQQIIDAPTHRWGLVVTLGGTDVTDRITGLVSIDAEESASTLATFSLLPESGPFDLLAWVGQAVTIDYLSKESSGAERWRSRRFTGEVIEPVHDPDTGLVRFSCSNKLQRRIAAMSREEIDAVIGGRWSAHVFDKDASAWQYAQDRLSTRPACLWIDASGVVRLTDWAAKATPDITHTEADRMASRVQVSRANKDRLKNQSDITLDFRFNRLKQRQQVITWRYPGSLCSFLKNPFPLPQRGQIQAAAEGSGWHLHGAVAFTPVWPGQVVNCGSGTYGEMDTRIWALDALGVEDPDLGGLCIGASFTLARRWVQTVTETYALQVVAPKSQEANGVIGAEAAYGVDASSDEQAVSWEQELSGLSAAGEGNTASAAGLAATMPAGTVELSNGDWLYEASEAESDGRAAMQEAQRTLLDRVRVEFLDAHRRNAVRYRVPFAAELDISKTLRLVTASVTAQGKLRACGERFDIGSGDAHCEVALAISRSGATGQVSESTRDPIGAPASDPLTSYAHSRSLGTYLGGRITSPDYDETWAGYVSNYEWDPDNVTPFDANPDQTAPVYPDQFVVDTIEIGEADRQAISASAAQVFQVDIPIDELTESAA